MFAAHAKQPSERRIGFSANHVGITGDLQVEKTWIQPKLSIMHKISYKIRHRILSYIKVLRNKQSTHIWAHCIYIILFPPSISSLQLLSCLQPPLKFMTSSIIIIRHKNPTESQDPLMEVEKES